jgi:transcriptional adapter 2-alpha
MPLRGDFDVEYDNDAELLLAEMEFNGNNLIKTMKLKKNMILK